MNGEPDTYDEAVRDATLRTLVDNQVGLTKIVEVHTGSFEQTIALLQSMSTNLLLLHERVTRLERRHWWQW